MSINTKRIIISRTDAIGDVVLTLPMAGLLKKYLPKVYIIFLGKDYTKEIIKASSYINEFISWDQIKILKKDKQIDYFKKLKADTIIHVFPNKEIAYLTKKAQIKQRIGTSHRIFHWFTCNHLIPLGRKKSNLHEAQLNIKLLSALKIPTTISLKEIASLYGYKKHLAPSLPEKLKTIIDTNKFKLILHPKSHGSAREWGINNFKKLVELLPSQKYQIFITGTEEEKKDIGDLLQNPKIIDLTAQLSLNELINFISYCDGLVAASTGPLHIAAAFEKKAIGIYPPIRPIHPQRWGPIGKNADFLVLDKICNDCKNGTFCSCMQEISPQKVLEKLES